MAKSKLQINLLSDRSPIGLDMLCVDCEEAYLFLESLPMHRDDNFVFLFMESGSASLTVDFDDVALKERQIYFMLPGQIHYNIKCRECTGWSIAISPSLINDAFKHVFDLQRYQQRPLDISPETFGQFRKLINLLHEIFRSKFDNIFRLQIIHSLLNAFLAMYARAFKESFCNKDQLSRPFHITQQFKLALNRDIKIEKRPSAYAEKLNISEIYLNKAVKATTGFTISYWIAQEVTIQAKRLLCISTLNVKEIAHQLDYEDHTYFSRLF